MSVTNGVLTALPAPEGYVVNFDDPNQIGHIAGYWTTGVGIGIAALFLAMRLYTRIFISRNFGFEDVAVVLSFACGLVTQSILLHLWVIKASGVHAWEMPFERYQFYTTVIMVASICYVPCLGFAKLSILVLYHRLSKLKWFKICTYIVMAIVASYSIGIVLALIFPCQPVAMNWDLSITEGKCIDKAGIYLATAAVNVITDFIILGMPIPVVLGLQMRKIQKIAVLGLFFVGSATFVTSIVRLVYMVPMVSNMDQTRAVSIPTVWIQVEANLVILATSLPMLRTFLRHFFPSVFEDSQGYNSDMKKYHNTGPSGHAYGGNSGHEASKLGTNRSIGRYGRMGSSGRNELDLSYNDSTRDLKSEEAGYPHAVEMRSNYGRDRGVEEDRFGGYGNKGYRNRSEIRGDASDVELADDNSDKAIWQTKTVTVEHSR